jgi:hypothetical protein
MHGDAFWVLTLIVVVPHLPIILVCLGGTVYAWLHRRQYPLAAGLATGGMIALLVAQALSVWTVIASSHPEARGDLQAHAQWVASITMTRQAFVIVGTVLLVVAVFSDRRGSRQQSLQTH